MENKRYKPLVDKLFFAIWVPTTVLMIVVNVVSFFAPLSLFIMIPVDVFTFYFLVSSLFGYVELRENTLFIKFGFIIKREIPYDKIRGFSRERKAYSETMLSLKNSMEHINIKYNRYDVIAVSVVDNDGFLRELEARMQRKP